MRDVLLIIGFVIACIVLYLELSPEFGKLYKGDDLKKVSGSSHFKKNKFLNVEDTNMLSNFSFKSIIKGLKVKNKVPKQKVPMKKISIEDIDTDDIKFVWFGHSSLLVCFNGKRILFDPMLTNVPSPVKIPWGVSSRFNNEIPLSVDDIDYIDVVMISHDHYDHLDYKTIKKLKNKVGAFYMPLGIKPHLERWGVAEEKIFEFDWWDKMNFEGLEMTCTPSRHFSGRGVFHKNSTLWCSWVIKARDKKIFFSGDTGYSKVYKKIGEVFGEFDLAFVECGQYNDMWPTIHMKPEESIRLACDINAKFIMPIHWGAFKLSMHKWNEPIERALVEAEKYNINLITPMIGEIVDLSENKEFNKWWKEVV